MARKKKTELYLAVDDGNVIVKEHPSVNAVLGYAQRLAEQAEKPCSFLIEREPVIGRKTPTHKVWRREDGVVLTMAV